MLFMLKFCILFVFFQLEVLVFSVYPPYSTAHFYCAFGAAVFSFSHRNAGACRKGGGIIAENH